MLFRSTQEVAALAANGVIALFIAAMSAAVIGINREKLSDTDRYCYRDDVWSTDCQDRVRGCLWNADLTNTGACKYAYAVGAISIFVQVLSFCFLWTNIAWPFNLVVSCFNVVWFAVAGGYFTKKFKDSRMFPEDSSRQAIIGLLWACLGLAGVQYIMAVTMTARLKKLREPEHKLQAQQQQPGLHSTVENDHVSRSTVNTGVVSSQNTVKYATNTVVPVRTPVCPVCC